MLNLVLDLWGKLKPKRKKQFFLLLILIILSTVSELFAIGGVIPFIAAITKPEILMENEFFGVILVLLEPIISLNETNIHFFITFVFISAVILSGAIRLLLLYVNTKLSFATGNDISVEIYRRTLYQSYEVHLLQNSSEVVSSILIKAKRMIGSVIMPIINIIIAAFFLFFLFLFFLKLNPMIFLYGVIFFGFIYFSIGFIFKKKLFNAGLTESREHQKVMQLLMEGLGGIRDVIIDNKQDFHISLFSNSDYKLRKAAALTTFLSSSPRFIIETVLILGLCLFTLFIFDSKQSIENYLPLIGSIALGSQRLLPILQNAFQSWANLKSVSPILSEILAFLDLPLKSNYKLGESELIFNQEIRFSNVSFKYQGSDRLVLNDLSFLIKKGTKIGIKGETGSGKSTLIDILMGLLTPTSGKLFVDNQELNPSNVKEWQKQLAHVPQSIFLLDASIKENIALGVPLNEIDEELVRLSAKHAMIEDFIDELPDKWNTKIGERGARLSGGQRQRIGLSRALYKRANFIVLDEATSALDQETEKSVMQSINNLGGEITVVIVAHRLSTLEACDEVFEVRNGKLIVSKMRDIV